jgi:hypothetical protein
VGASSYSRTVYASLLQRAGRREFEVILAYSNSRLTRRPVLGGESLVSIVADWNRATPPTVHAGCGPCAESGDPRGSPGCPNTRARSSARRCGRPPSTGTPGNGSAPRSPHRAWQARAPAAVRAAALHLRVEDVKERPPYVRIDLDPGVTTKAGRRESRRRIDQPTPERDPPPRVARGEAGGRRRTTTPRASGCGSAWHRSHEALCQRVGDGAGPCGLVELREDVGDVAVHGVSAEGQYGSDLVIAHAPGDEPQHLCLAWCEDSG